MCNKTKDNIRRANAEILKNLKNEYWDPYFDVEYARFPPKATPKKDYTVMATLYGMTEKNIKKIEEKMEKEDK